MTAEQTAPAAAGPVGGITRRQLYWLLGGLIIGLFLAATEQSVVATALPTIAGELGGANRIAAVVSAYLLTSTVVTPLYGKLSDLYGRRIVYQASIAIFIVGSALCGLAQSMDQLIAARVVQGAGGGGLMSLAFVIIGDVLSPRERGRYIGVFTGAFAFSSVTGPLWGGLLVDTVGWRWIFLVIVPAGLIGLAVTSVGLRLPFAVRKRPIDWAGALLLVTASSALILVPIWGESGPGWTSPRVTIVGVVGVVLTVLFVLRERVAEEPILPLRLFTDRTVSATFVMGFLLMAALISVSTFMPLFLQIAKGVSATSSGLRMVPQTIGITLTATITGNIVSRVGRYKWSMLAGPAIAAVGVGLLSTIDAATGFPELAVYLVLLGVGLGMVFPNMTLAVQNVVSMADLGVGTTTANFFRNMGATFGAAVAGAVVNARLGSELAERVEAERLASFGGAEGLLRSPKVVRDLPTDLHDAVGESVTVAVTSTFRWAVPVMLLLIVLALLVREAPLRTMSAMQSQQAPPE